MSDEIIGQVAPEGEALPEATPVTESQSTAPDETGKEATPEGKPAEKTFTQDEVDRILQKRLAKEQKRIERYAAMEAENRVLREQRQAREPQPEAPQMPKPEQFSDYETYLAAVADYKVEERLNQRLAQMSEAQRAAEQQRQIRERISTAEARFAAAQEKYDDFEQVARNPDLPVTDVMAQVMLDMDKGADVAYHLGKNPAEAARIARLPTPYLQVLELAKIELGLSAPAVPAPTKAPAPISPVGTRAKVGKDPGQMSDAEYAKWRRSGKAA